MLSVILPAYNEENNIKPAIKEIADFLTELLDFEIVAVNDGSKDRTGEALEEAARERKNLSIVTHPRNLGYGAALRSGFAKASGDLIFFTDSDRQFDIRDLKIFLEKTKDHDFIIGYREKRKDPPPRVLYAKLYAKLARFLFGVEARDINCAFKMFQKETLQDLSLFSSGALINLEVLTLAAKKGYKFLELPVSHRPRIAGKQTGGSFKVITKAVINIFSLWWRLKFKELNPKTLKITTVAILIVLGLLSRFLFIWQPAKVVFDEVHYGKYANGYFTGENFFSGHPPLGAQLIALGGWLGGYKPNFKFDHIGEKFSDNSFIALRFMPNLAGALIPATVAVFALILGFSIMAAFSAGVLLTFENALLVQSHFILTDAFVILFGFFGLCFFFSSRQKNYNLSFLFLSGLFLGLSSAVKWTGMGFLLLASLTAALDFVKGFRGARFKDSVVVISKFIAGLLLIPFILYFLTIALHFYLLPNKGPGDVYFSKDFVEGRKNLPAKFIEFNKVSYESNVKWMMTAHPFSSRPYAWPFGLKSIFYWGGENAKIYLAGNPVIWWASTTTVLVLLLYAGLRKVLQDQTAVILLAGYFLNLLPFAAVSRVVFLYHYLSSLIFAVLILAYLLDTQKNSKTAFVILLLLALAGFIYFTPTTYGFPRYF